MGTREIVGAAVALLVVVACTVVGARRRRTDGVGRPIVNDHGGAAERMRLLADLGAGGSPVTLVQFSTPQCGPCRTTRALCESLASTIDGVRHVDVDAPSRLDAVRAFGITRTPTLLMIDQSGQVVHCWVGPPSRQQLTGVIHGLGAVPR